jgi:uncharacterized heparinase superfamily protein
MSAATLLKRMSRLARRRLSLLAGGGIRSAQTLTMAEFLARLDTGAFGARTANGDDRVAALISHFGKRTKSDWPDIARQLTDLRIDLDEMSSDAIVARADAALEHDLHPSGVRPVLRPGGMIDWSANPTGNREWLLMLHRHAWWSLWAAAYDVTSDEKYARAFVDQITDWISQNRMPPLKSEHHAPWRLMECGLRLRISWIPAFGYFYKSAAFTDDAKLQVLRAIYDHCNFLRHFFTNRNHLVRESNGLVAGAIAFPEFSEAEEWLAEGIARLDRELGAQVNVDGSHIEMSTGYQWLAIDEFEITRSLLQPVSRSLPNADLAGTLEKMYEFLTAVMRPDRCFPQLNDGFILWNADRLEAAARKLDRHDLEHAATCGTKGQPPARTSRSFPNAGLHVMRSGFATDSRYLIFDTGPYGGPHGHEDKLSFELYAFGTPFIVDPGSFTYEPGDPYRTYFVGSQGHNTILVDGASQVRRWSDLHMCPVAENSGHGEWISNEGFDWACGKYDEGYAEFALQRPADARPDFSASHTRQIIFVKPDYWIVVDKMEAQSAHDYTALFHLAPDIEVHEHSGAGATLWSNRTDACLFLATVSTDEFTSEVISGRESPIQGWYSEDHHKKEPAAALAFNVANVCSTIVAWLLIPSPDGKNSARIENAAHTGTETEALSFEVVNGSSRDSVSIERRRENGPANTISITRSNGCRWP